MAAAAGRAVGHSESLRGSGPWPRPPASGPDGAGGSSGGEWAGRGGAKGRGLSFINPYELGGDPTAVSASASLSIPFWEASEGFGCSPPCCPHPPVPLQGSVSPWVRTAPRSSPPSTAPRSAPYSPSSITGSETLCANRAGLTPFRAHPALCRDPAPLPPRQFAPPSPRPPGGARRGNGGERGAGGVGRGKTALPRCVVGVVVRNGGTAPVRLRAAPAQ